MTLNTYGAVQLNDFGNPKVLSGRAREAISGGQLVTGSTAGGIVSSGADSFNVSTDVKWYLNGSGAAFNGMALATVGSNGLLPVAVEGVFIATVRTNTAAGAIIGAAGDDSFALAGAAGHNAGRSITEGTSGGYFVIHLRA